MPFWVSWLCWLALAETGSRTGITAIAAAGGAAGDAIAVAGHGGLELFTGAGTTTGASPAPLGEKRNVFAAAFVGDRLLEGGGLAGQSGEVRCWSWREKKLLWKTETPGDVFYAVAVAGGAVYAAGGDRRIVASSLESGAILRVLEGHAGPILALAVSPDGRILASAGADRSIRLWNLEDHTLIRAIHNHAGSIHALAWSPDGRTLASGSADRTVRTWQPEIGRLLRIIRGHDDTVLALLFAGDRLISGSADGKIRWIDPRSGAIEAVEEKHPDWIAGLAPAPGGFLSADWSGRVIQWNAASRAARELEIGLAEQLPRIPPLEPQDELRSFSLEPGFRIELVAAEPLVIDPVALEFDGRGRMFVVEMRDYPFTSEPDNMTASPEAAAQPSGRIRLLEDADGDGRMDRSGVFADGLAWPTGLALWKDGVFAVAAPDILYFRDADGDGKADERRVVWTGFGRKNVQALANNLKWGFDNRIYIAGGMNGGSLVAGEGPRGEPVSAAGRDLRFIPGQILGGGGGRLEAIPGGGQFGQSFDSFGRRFVCSNSSHLLHAVFPGANLDRNPNLPARRALAEIPVDGGAAPVFRTSRAEPWRILRTRWRAGSPEASKYASTELVPAGFFTAATGVTIYRGDIFPPEYRDSAFVCDAGSNLVHRKVLEPGGPTFIARRPDPSARREFLASTDNWFRPVNLGEGPDGALYILDMYRETIEHPYSIPDSIKRHLRLTSGNDRGRIWRIVPAEFKRPGAPPDVQEASPDLREASPGALAAMLEHPNAWRRLAAQRLLVERQDPAAEPLLRKIAAGSASPHAAIHALWTLEGLGRLEASDVRAALRHAAPRVREQAALLAESRLDAATSGGGILDDLLPLAGDADVRVRFQAALSLGETRHPRAAAALARIARSDGADPWMRLAILSSASHCAGALFEALAAGGEPGAAALLEPLAEAIGASGDAAGIGAVLASGKAAAALAGLGQGLQRSGGSLPEFIEKQAAAAPGQAAILRILFEGAARDARDAGLPVERRAEAVRLLRFAPFGEVSGALRSLLGARTPQPLQLQAIQALAAHRAGGVAPALLDGWAQFSPALRREALEALFQRSDRLAALLAALESESLPRRDIDPDRRRQLLAHADAEVRRRAGALFEREPPGERRAALEKYRASLDLAGDAGRGREIYRRKCATCHRLEAEGFTVGPDLATVRGRAADSILEQIIDPNREILPAYINYLALTRDGRAISGIVAAESAAGLTLRRAEGAEDEIQRSSLRSLQGTGLSLMPEGLEADLTPQDMADLLECIVRP